MTQRRKFLKQSAALLATSVVAQNIFATDFAKSSPLKKLGVNLFSIPKILEQDFAAGMKMLSGIGYKEIEFFGPYEFSPAAEKEGWAAVTPSLGFSGSGFFGLKLHEAKQILDDNGLTCPSMHSGLPTLSTAMDQLAEAANILGAKYVTLPSAQTQSSLDGYKRQADDFNSIGKAAKEHGIRFAYHNHGNGLTPLDGTVPFDLLMKNTDPQLVYYQMDIYWMTAGGVDLVDYLKKYRGRFRLMHLKDMAKQVRFSGDGGDPTQWIELFPHLTNAGSGVLDLKSILTQAVDSKIEHFIVERDLAPNPEEDLRASLNYLSKLDVSKK